MNPTITLAAIRAAQPCANGWTKLLTGLGYADGLYDPERAVSLGDIATTNDAVDTLWCARVLDWSDIAIRRAVMTGAVLPTIRRAFQGAADPLGRECLKAFELWCADKDSIDLAAAAKATLSETSAATWAVYDAAMAANDVTNVAYILWAALWATEAADDEDAERELQRTDIIAAFPIVALS